MAAYVPESEAERRYPWGKGQPRVSVLGRYRKSKRSHDGMHLSGHLDTVVATTALPAIGPSVNGPMAGVVGILLATIYRLGKPNIKDRLTWGIALLAFAVGALLDTSVALIVVAAGLLGMILLSPRSAAQEYGRKEGRR